MNDQFLWKDRGRDVPAEDLGGGFLLGVLLALSAAIFGLAAYGAAHLVGWVK